MSDFIWYNGHWLSGRQAALNARDRIRLGDGVFDTMLSVGGQAIYAEHHFKRLKDACVTMGIAFTMGQHSFNGVVADLIRRNKATDARYAVNTLVTRGAGARGLMPADDVTPSVILMITKAPAPEDFPPVHAIIAQTVRRNEGSPLSRIKSCNYGDNILALNEAKQRGANEAILLNNAGYVTCASAGNLLVAMGTRLYTPPLSDGVMNGIQRSHLVTQSKVEERSLLPDDLKNAEALYLVNSIRGITPIVKLEGADLPRKPASHFL